MASQFLALSLFIVLLSFFIVLNSISTFEVDKARPVLDSLGKTFRADGADPLSGLSEISVVSAGDYARGMEGRGSLLDRVGGLFSSRVPGADIRRNRLGTEMAIRMSFADFLEQADAALASADGEEGEGDAGLLPVLVSLMDQDRAGAAYRMDMILETARKPHEAAQADGRDGAALAGLARRLETEGLPANLAGIGFEPGQEGMITLHFRPHEPFNPDPAKTAAAPPPEGAP